MEEQEIARGPEDLTMDILGLPREVSTWLTREMAKFVLSHACQPPLMPTLLVWADTQVDRVADILVEESCHAGPEVGDAIRCVWRGDLTDHRGVAFTLMMLSIPRALTAFTHA